MPFSCIFQLNNGAIAKTDEIIFDGFIDSTFDKFQKTSVKFARVRVNGSQGFIYSNCPCYVSSKGDIKQGEMIDESSKLGYFSAEGEDIPYSRPYAIIRFG